MSASRRRAPSRSWCAKGGCAAGSARDGGGGSCGDPRGEGAPALAFVTPRIGLEWALDVYGGFEAVAAEAGHVSLLSSTAGRPLLDAAGIERLLSEYARGLALSHLLLTEDARAILPDLRARGVRWPSWAPTTRR